MTSQKMTEKRAELIAKMRETTQRAEREKRDLTRAEFITLEADLSEAEELRSKIERAQATEERQAEAAFKSGRGLVFGHQQSGTFHGRTALELYKRGQIGQELKAIDTTSGAGSIDTDVLTQQYITYLGANNPLFALGARLEMDDNNKKWAKITGLPAVVWPASEGTQITADSGFTIGSVQREHKTLATKVVKVSREYLDDAGGLAERLVDDAINTAIGDEIITRVLNGNGTDHPTGLDNTSGVNFVPAGGALADYSKIIAAAKKVLLDRVPVGRLGILHSVESYTQLAALQDTTDQPLMAPDLVKNMPYGVSTGVSNSRLYLGDWSQLVVGMRGPVTLRLVELYADSLQVGYIAYVRLDWSFLRPNNFAIVTGITATSPTT